MIDPTQAVIWFASKELTKDKQLKDYLGKNEKTKVNALYPWYNYKVASQTYLQVVVKLNTTGSGPPVREPMFNEEERKAMMLAEHRRREEVSPIFPPKKPTWKSTF